MWFVVGIFTGIFSIIIIGTWVFFYTAAVLLHPKNDPPFRPFLGESVSDENLPTLDSTKLFPQKALLGFDEDSEQEKTPAFDKKTTDILTQIDVLTEKTPKLPPLISTRDGGTEVPKTDAHTISRGEELNTLFEDLDLKSDGGALVVKPEFDPQVRKNQTRGDGKYVFLDSYGGVSRRTHKDKGLISNFTAEICNKTYLEACAIAQLSGYELHILYVGLSDKMPRDKHSDKVIGVRVRDSDFKNGVPSKHAIVTEIVDIGGMDVDNVGAIKL